MTKKEKVIAAMVKTAEKYEKPVGHEFFFFRTCPICNVIHTPNTDTEERPCAGCPLASADADAGCTKFRTFIEAWRAHEGGDLINPPEFLARATTLRKHAAICETWPESRFTPEGWTYSGEELSRDD